MANPNPGYDVFLSHNSADKPAVEQLARRLLDAGVKPWLPSGGFPCTAAAGQRSDRQPAQALGSRAGSPANPARHLRPPVAALDTDIGRTLGSLEKQVQEERRAELLAERQQIVDQLDTIEAQLAR